MNSSLTDRIEQNRFSGEARSLRHQQADEAIRNHYAANCKQAARALVELLEEQRTLLAGGEYTLEETAIAVVEEFDHALKGINHMPRSWANGTSTHYDKANAKATREYLDAHIPILAETMAFLGNPPAPPADTLWDFHRQSIRQNPENLEEAFVIANRIQAGKIEDSQDALNLLFLRVLDGAAKESWWQDRVRHVRLHLDRSKLFRTMRRDAAWAMDS